MNIFYYDPETTKVGRFLSIENDTLSIQTFVEKKKEILDYDSLDKVIKVNKSQVQVAKIISQQMFHSRSVAWPVNIFYSKSVHFAIHDEDDFILASKIVCNAIFQSLELCKTRSIIHLNFIPRWWQALFSHLSESMVKKHKTIQEGTTDITFINYKPTPNTKTFIRTLQSFFLDKMPSDAEAFAEQYDGSSLALSGPVPYSKFYTKKKAIMELAKEFQVSEKDFKIKYIKEKESEFVEELTELVIQRQKGIEDLSSRIGSFKKSTNSYHFLLEDRKEGDPVYVPEHAEMTFIFDHKSSELTIKFNYVIRNRVGRVFKA